MVRLKEIITTIINALFTCFNSNMVRLKVNWRASVQKSRLWFQFQYGTIKSSERNYQNAYNTPFQFQYGTIKSVVSIPP